MQQNSDHKTKLVSQVENWRSHLLDIGNRNPLINTSFSASRGVLDLVHPEPEVIWRKLIISGEAGSRSLRFPWKRDLVPPVANEPSDNPESSTKDSEVESKDWNPPFEKCLESPNLQPDDLLTTLGDRALDRRVRTLDGYAELSISEQGIHSLFLAFGFIKWFESNDSNKEILSPLLLVPASFNRETADSPWELLEAEDDVVDNLCLRQRFKQDFGLELPPLPELEQLEEEGARLTYLDSVRKSISKIKRWEVLERCSLGRFAFPKIAMWQDLGEHIDSISASKICRSIGSQTVEDPCGTFGDPTLVPDAKQLDEKVGPGEIKAILDCDSSQLEAIVAARQGVSFVLDGPPGTGKSQTIANIIADALSVGKRVLFVSEKVAALEVVKRRLDESGLGDFCLECHSSKANRKTVLEELKVCLDLPVETYPDPCVKLNELRLRRRQLNDYVRVLHQPQQPIGLSMYELHGNIARLTRMGLLGKSNIEFPSPTTVTGPMLESWRNELRLASLHQSVLTAFDKHPWRGCTLKHQTLSQKSNIRNHFSLLSEKAKELSTSLAPLEDDGLIPLGTKVSQLNSLSSYLESNLNILDIPQAWFASPKKIATALLVRHNSHLKSIQLRQALPEYNENVTTLFNDEILTLTEIHHFGWVRRLNSRLPADLDGCRRSLTNYAQSLREFESTLETLDSCLRQLLAELKLPLKGEPPFSSIAKLVSAAKLVATDAPFRSNWFETDRAALITSNARTAISKINSIATVTSKLGDRVDTAVLQNIVQNLSDVDELSRSWEIVRTRLPAVQTSELKCYAERLQTAHERLEKIHSDFKSLAGALHWNLGNTPTFTEAKEIVRALPDFLLTDAYNGKWADAEIRGKIKQQIEAVILDLAEANESRRILESKFSHRAFLPSARSLIERGKRFSTWWQRLVGGYSKFRTEVADIYKSIVPDTTSLLSDLSHLATYHKRILDVEKVLRDLDGLLIPCIVAEQADSWQKALDSLRTFEEFLAAVPHVSSLMPPAAISVTMRPSAPLIVSLSESLERICSKEEQALFETLGIADTSITTSLQVLTELRSAFQCTATAYHTCVPRYHVVPDMPQLLSDLIVARTHSADLREIDTLFREHLNDLPKNAQPFEINCWSAAIRGVESADKLSKIFQGSLILKETICKLSQLEAETIAVLADSTELALKQANLVWSEKIGFINLNSLDDQMLEAKKLKISDLRSSVAAAASEFETLAACLEKLLATLKPNQSVPLERLPQDATAISELRISERSLIDCNSVLSQFQIEHPTRLSQDDIAICKWLRDAPDELLNSPLARKIATCPVRRSQVHEVLTNLKLTIGQTNDSFVFWEKIFPPNQEVSFGFVRNEIAIKDLSTILESLLSSIDLIDEWILFNQWREQMVHLGFETVIDELIKGKYAASEAVDAVCGKFYQQLFDELTERLPQIGTFNGDQHEQIRGKYRELDEWELKSAAARIREFQLTRQDRPRFGFFESITSELGILKKETEKKRRHMPLRKLFNTIPDVLQRLKPCIMMSPLSVSTFLQAETLRFDLVIFDEASQVFPWDAIGAIYRGNQLIVAGDDKQLPPTNFFSRAEIDVEEEEGDEIGDYESILSLCKSINMPNKRLRWHYRSRREPLIAFSNRHFYDGELVTFPSVFDASRDAVQFVLVSDGCWSQRKNKPEAAKVAQLVVEHFKQKPEKSLGVIAFNASQQQAIEDAIYELRKSSPIVDALLQQETEEPLFIKNLENVQGDERDVIILSFGYGKNESGKFVKNFGPLSRPGGERRLNVAVTRARESVTLVASVRASDMDLSDSISKGAQLIKAYLEYAEHGIDSIGKQIIETHGKCESPFEEAVATALIQHGLEPVPQVGCGGFRIDLALKHPAHPGLYCLGIECDGATYHSSKTARDRDRIRQTILEGLGWKIFRVWSTDWVHNPDIQIQRILSCYEQAISIPPDQVLSSPIKPELDFDDLQPIKVSDAAILHATYVKIEDVPTHVIDNMLNDIVNRVGSIESSELISLSTRELGFARTGRKIRERLEDALRSQVKSSKLRLSGGRVYPAANP